MKNIVFAIALMIIAFTVGYIISSYTSFFSPPPKIVEEHSNVLLERVKTVSKLVTVEGYFSDIYTYKDHYYYDLSPFRKKAILLVKAKVMVGYDLSKMKYETRPDEKVLVISNLPEPEIISIDPEVRYYDLSEGTFNSFSSKELTKLNANARKLITDQAMNSNLTVVAKQKGNDVLELIKLIVRDAGWTIRYEDDTIPIPNNDTDSSTLKD